MIKISPKNQKLGLIPSVSVLPGRDCPRCDHCISACYAVRLMRLRPPFRKSLEVNSYWLRERPSESFAEINAYLQWARPRYFRIHVAGDFFSQSYADRWIETARAHPGTQFLAFTATDGEITFNSQPANMEVIYSAWPGVLDSAPPGRRAHVFDPRKGEAPPNGAKVCPDGCDTCGYCFNPGGDIWFIHSAAKPRKRDPQ
jgi:ferredoxin